MDIHEFLKDKGDIYDWETSLYEEILEYEWKNDLLEAYDNFDPNDFEIGDIVFVPQPVSAEHPEGVGGHRVIVISKKFESTDDKTGKKIMRYAGFLLSSKVYNSNKYRPNVYPNSIFIKDYSSIIRRGPKPSLPAYVNVDETMTFTTKDLSEHGSFKGHVTDEFLDFVLKCNNNFKVGVPNDKIYWEK